MLIPSKTENNQYIMISKETNPNLKIKQIGKNIITNNHESKTKISLRQRRNTTKEQDKKETSS